MTTERDYDVIDHYGRVVRRTKVDGNGIVADGEGVRVRMTMMDAANPALAHAAAVADAIKRAEAFDASRGVGHRPGYSTQDAGDAGEKAREARDAKMRDAWRNPAPVLDAAKPQQHAALVPPTASHADLFKARDQAAQDRDRRLESAWKS